MKIEDVNAVIASAKARGTESLERFIARRLEGASEAEVKEAADVALEIIESIPVFLARAAQEAEQRQLKPAVDPLLEYAFRYFLSPVDLIPEMTQGLAGLLDDAYLVLRTLENLDKGPEPFLDWELDEPLTFLRELIGPRVGAQLDAMAGTAEAELSSQLSHLWGQVSQQA